MKYTLKIKPVSKGRPRFTKDGRCYTPKNTRDFERDIKRLIDKGIYYHQDKPLCLTVNFTFKTANILEWGNWYTKSPDLDNLIKSVSDALNKLVFDDDSQITRIVCTKKYGRENQIDLKIKELRNKE